MKEGPWHFRLFCKCGGTYKVTYCDPGLTKSMLGVCPSCGRRAAEMETKVVRRVNKGSWLFPKWVQEERA